MHASSYDNKREWILAEIWVWSHWYWIWWCSGQIWASQPHYHFEVFLWICFPIYQTNFISVAVQWTLFIFSGQIPEQKKHLIGLDKSYHPYLDRTFYTRQGNSLLPIYELATLESGAHPWSNQLWATGKVSGSSSWLWLHFQQRLWTHSMWLTCLVQKLLSIKSLFYIISSHIKYLSKWHKDFLNTFCG